MDTQRPIKILHLDSEKSWRGGEQQVAYLIQGLAIHGLESHVAARSDSELYQYCHKNKIPVHEIPFGGQQVLSSQALISLQKKEGFDLWHLHTAKAHSAAALASLSQHCPDLVLSKRTDFPIKNNLWSRWKYDLAKIKNILCVSKKIQEITNQGLKDPSRTQTIYSGVNPERFQVEKDVHFFSFLPKEAIKIGNTSALAPHKDYPVFIETAEKLIKENTNFHFIIMGKGPLEEQLKALVKTKNLQEHIHFTGYLDNLGAILPSLDLFLMTSETEGLGTSLIDAMLSRVPIVSTDAGGIPELVKDSETGLLAPVKDSDHLKVCVERLVRDHQLKEKLVTTAYDYALQNFHFQKTADRTFQIYQEILNS